MVGEKLEFNQLKEFIEGHLNKRFETLRSDRESLEQNWVQRIKSVNEGTAPSPAKSSLIKFYTNLGDPTLPSLVRKAHAREVAWLDRDFFRWVPDGVESVDTDGAYWLTNYQKDNLNNELSNFHPVIRAAILERRILNLSGINYSWLVQPKYEFDYDVATSEDGLMQMKAMQKKQLPFEYEIQGIKFEFASIFNVYPDIIQQTSFETLTSLDLFHFNYKTYKEVKEHKLFDPNAHYPYMANVLYRSTDGLGELKDETASFTNAHRNLNRYLDGDSSTAGNKKMLEIRVAHVKEMKLPGQDETMCAEGRGFRIIYAFASGKCVPLFVEANPAPFEKKTLRLSRYLDSPHALYNSSEVGLAANQHFYIVNSKQQQAHALNKAVNPNLLWSSALLEAFKGSADQLKEMWTQTGHNEYFNQEIVNRARNAGATDITRPLVMGGQDMDIRNLELFQQAIDKARLDIQQFATSVNNETGADATAQFNKQVATEQDLIATENKASIGNDWLRPALEYGVEMAKAVFQDQKFATRLSLEDQKELIELAGVESFDEIKKAAINLKQSLAIPKHIGEAETLVQYNPVTERKQIMLNKTLFRNTKASFNLEFESSEYSKPLELEEKMQIYGNILNSLPDSPLKFYVAKIAIEQSLQLTNDPHYAEIKEEVDKMFQKMVQPQEPTPQEQAQLVLQAQNAEAEIQDKEASAMLKKAQANEEQSRAEKQYQEVQEKEVVNQLLGV